MATLGSLIVNVLANTSGFAKSMKGVRGELNSLNAFGEKVKDQFGLVGGALAAIGVGFSAHAVVSGLNDIAEGMDDLAKVADRLGVSTEVFKGLEYGAGLAGVSSDSLAGSLQFLSKQIGEAIHGGGKAKVVFDELGLSAHKLSKMSADQQLRTLADSLSRVGTDAEKTRMALRLFGGDGAAMLTFLSEGEQAIGKYMREAERLGLTYSREEAAKVEEFNDAWETLAKTLGGIGTEIVIRLAPTASQAIKDLTEAVEGAKLILGNKQLQNASNSAIGVAGGLTMQSGIGTGTLLGAKGAMKLVPAAWGAGGKLLNSLFMSAGVATSAGAFTDAELGGNAKRFRQFSEGLPGKEALSLVNEQRFQRSVTDVLKKVFGSAGAKGAQIQDGFRALSGVIDKAKGAGRTWQNSWLLGEVFGRKGDSKIDAIFKKRDMQKAEEQRRLEALASTRNRFNSGGGFNSAVEAGTPEALRAIASSREQNRMLDRMVAEQRKTNDQARQQTSHLATISMKLNLETTGLN